tara:strand:- start:4181 stop:5206 length:1026 start_codon:yes stop_codon:yes gene_type:complete
MKIKLEILYSDGGGGTFSFDKEIISVGRSSSNDLVISDEMVSRTHCELHIKGDDRINVICKSSKNGIIFKDKIVDSCEISNDFPLFSLGNTDIKLIQSESSDRTRKMDLNDLVDIRGRNNKVTFGYVSTLHFKIFVFILFYTSFFYLNEYKEEQIDFFLNLFGLILGFFIFSFFTKLFLIRIKGKCTFLEAQSSLLFFINLGYFFSLFDLVFLQFFPEYSSDVESIFAVAIVSIFYMKIRKYSLKGLKLSGKNIFILIAICIIPAISYVFLDSDIKNEQIQEKSLPSWEKVDTPKFINIITPYVFDFKRISKIHESYDFFQEFEQKCISLNDERCDDVEGK